MSKTSIFTQIDHDLEVTSLAFKPTAQSGRLYMLTPMQITAYYHLQDSDRKGHRFIMETCRCDQGTASSVQAYLEDVRRLLQPSNYSTVPLDGLPLANDVVKAAIPVDSI